MKIFSEHVYREDDGEFIASSAAVTVDEDGYFVSITAGDYESCAMFTLPVARGVREALDRAIAFAEDQQRQKQDRGREVSEGS